MIHPLLIAPRSIAVIGASDKLHTPGGRLLDNLIKHGFEGKIYPVNPKKTEINGLKVYQNIKDIPQTDLAIIAIAARYVEETVKVLTERKDTKAFIIISAGFSDAGEEGAALEKRIVAQIERYGGSLLGPNNIGLINRNYAGVFTTPVPELDTNGVTLISGSGATAVFIMEAAMQRGMRFKSVWTVGNSAQIGVEEVLEHIDLQEKAEPGVIMLYIEHIRNPEKLLRHARSLYTKGYRLTGIKAGSSPAGSRAAASHTGAMASPDVFADALFEKAGILRSYGRYELIDHAMVMSYPKGKGKNVAVITHAGGPGVMLTDVLEKNGMQVPEITHPKKEELQAKLYPGASVKNPIDILATGTAEQLNEVLRYTNDFFEQIDMSAVIFGSPGLFSVYDAYDVILKFIKQGGKPLYPVLPSVINVKDEIAYFIEKGGQVFFDEVALGKALGKVYGQTPVFERPELHNEHSAQHYETGKFLSPQETYRLLQTFHIPAAEQIVVKNTGEIDSIPASMYPLAMKIVGPLHKTESGGVKLNIAGKPEARAVFNELMRLENAEAVLVQPFIKSPVELFAGIKFDSKFGHLLMFGKGGTDVEIWQDTAKVLLPSGREELRWHLKRLKIYKYFEGYRNQKPLPENDWLDLLQNLGALVHHHPYIKEIDLNPVLFNGDKYIVVDARIST